MADSLWPARLAAFQAFLEPAPDGFDLFYWLVSMLGFTVSHGMENMNRPNKTYVDQLLEAGPSTYFGYLVGLLIAGIPFVELLVSLPFFSHLLGFINILDFSQKSAFQICIYVVHAGKVFGWKMTAFLMGLGFVFSPMLTTGALLLGGPQNFYYFVVGVTGLQVVCTALSGWKYCIFHNFTELSLNAMVTVTQNLPGNVFRIFERMCGWYGVESELQSVLHRRDSNQKMAKFHMFFEEPDDARKFPLRLLKEISKTVAPGTKLMNCECSFRNIALNIKGMRIRQEGSPEYGVMKMLRNSRPNSPAITKRTMGYQSEKENEGIRVCLDAGFAVFRDDVLVSTDNDWSHDKTRRYLRNLDSQNSPNQPPRKFLVSFMDRNLIDAIVDFKGQIRRPRNITSYISLSIPDTRGSGVAV